MPRGSEFRKQRDRGTSAVLVEKVEVPEVSDVVLFSQQRKGTREVIVVPPVIGIEESNEGPACFTQGGVSSFACPSKGPRNDANIGISCTDALDRVIARPVVGKQNLTWRRGLPGDARHGFESVCP